MQVRVVALGLAPPQPHAATQGSLGIGFAGHTAANIALHGVDQPVLMGKTWSADDMHDSPLLLTRMPVAQRLLSL